MEISCLPHQEQVLFCPSRFIGFFMGRRGGKSETFARRFKVKVLSNANFRYGYITPTALQNEEAFERLIGDEDLQPYIKRTKTRPCRMWLTNGGFLGMYSFQRSQNLKGRFFNEVWGDESQDLVGSEWWRVVRPMLSDRRGTMILSGQLPSKVHWTHRDFYEPGQAAPGSKLNPLDNGPDGTPTPRYASWAIPSWENTVIFGTEDGKAELEIARTQMPDWMFRADYGCEPLGAQNAVFAPDRLAAVIGAEIPTEPNGAFIIGHDIGRIRDCGATVVARFDGDRFEQGTVVYAKRFPLGMAHAEQATALKTLSDRFNKALVCVDATGGGQGGKHDDDAVKIYHDVIKNCRSVFMTPATKPEIVTCLSVGIEQKTLGIPNEFRELIEELEAYEATYHNGYWRFSAPKGCKDDLIMGLALCTWARKKGWISRRTPGAVASWGY